MKPQRSWLVAIVSLGTLVCAACGDDTGSGGSGGSNAGAGGAGGAASTGGGAVGGAATGGNASGGAPGTGGAGGGAASAECTPYCTEFMAHCQSIPNVETYTDEADCLATCAGFAHGTPGEFQGNTVDCRLAHLTFDPMPGAGYYELHCFHAQENPTANCF